MEEQQNLQDKADVLAALGRISGERRFLIQNVGSVSAFDVQLTVEPERGKNSPLVANEYKRKFPVEELQPGHGESLQAIITTGTGIHFRGLVSWKNPDGSREERAYELSA